MNKKLPLLIALFMVSAQTIFSQNIIAYNWAKLAGGANGADLTWDITSDTAGNVYITGRFAGDSVDFDPGAAEFFLESVGDDDIFLAKYTPAGNLIWAIAVGSENSDEARSVVLDKDGNVWITGTFAGTADFDPGSGVQTLTTYGARDIFLAKYDNNGNYLWAGAMGGNDDDVAGKIACHPTTGDIWICGGFEGTADLDPSSGIFTLISLAAKDIFYARYSTAGALIGARRLQGSGNDLATSLDFDSDGNLLLCGIFVGTINFNPTGTAFNLASNNGSNDAFVAKYDLSATLLWAKALGGKTQNDYAINVKADANNNVIVCGYFADTCTFQPGVGIATKVALGVADAFVANYDSTGNFEGIITYGSAGEYVSAYDVTVDNDGYIYVTGYASNVFDAGNSPNNPQIINTTGKNAYLLKYDLIGNYFVGANITYGAFNTTGFCIHADAQGGILVGGELQGTGDFDPSVLNKSLTSFSGSTDAFWGRYFNCNIPGQVYYETDTVCPGQTATLQAGGAIEYTVEWYADEQASVFLGQNLYTTPALDTSTIYYLMDSVCGIKKVTPVTVLVHPNPDNTVVQQNNVLTAVQAAGVSYQWGDCNTEQPIIGATSYQYTATANGTYAVQITDNETGCVNFSDCYVVNISGVDDMPWQGTISLYPNPATQTVNVVWHAALQPYTIYNAMGAVMQTGTLSAGIHTIDISEWAGGVYLLRTQNSTHQLLFTKH